MPLLSKNHFLIPAFFDCVVTVDKPEEAFHESVDNYIAISRETGRPAQKPYSGKLMLRIPPDIHAAVATIAQANGKSINQWATETLKEAVQIEL